MPLVKFAALDRTLGECWIDLLDVTSVCPLRGVPNGADVKKVTDISQTVLVGSRTVCAGHVFDLAVDPDVLAADVAIARGEQLEPSRAPLPSSVAPH